MHRGDSLIKGLWEESRNLRWLNNQAPPAILNYKFVFWKSRFSGSGTPRLTLVNILAAHPGFWWAANHSLLPLMAAMAYLLWSLGRKSHSLFFTSFFQLLNFFSSTPNLTLPLQEQVTLPKSLFVGWQTILTFHMPAFPLNAQMHFIFPQYKEPLAKEVGT